LYHFLPGAKTLSISTAGCNLKCGNCSSWKISQQKPEKVKSISFSPSDILEKAQKDDLSIISYAFGEPTAFYEYMVDISKLAKDAGVKNVINTNGFFNHESLKQLCSSIDACNVDLKGINDDFYQMVCGGGVKPVLESIKTLKENGVWVEITNLLIPELNDSEEDITKLVTWIYKNLGADVPLHFTAFYPEYKITKLPATPSSTLEKARRIALGKGLNYVYAQNVEEGQDTHCPSCKEKIIKRDNFNLISSMEKGKCSKCGKEIAGVWD